MTDYLRGPIVWQLTLFDGPIPIYRKGRRPASNKPRQRRQRDRYRRLGDKRLSYDRAEDFGYEP